MKTKNNRGYLQSILGAILAVSAVLILSCEQPDGAFSGAPAGKGSVVLTVSTGSPPGSTLKTVLPEEKPEFSVYKLVFTKGELTVEEETDKDLLDGTETFEVQLDPGEWDVTVTAYSKFEADGEPYEAAKGAGTVTVTGGSSVRVTVSIQPIPIADSAELTGRFTYTVSYEGDDETVNGTLKLGDEEVDLTFGEEVSTDLKAGYHKFSILLTNEAGLTAGVTEVVHIYAGLNSKAEFTFTDDNFAAKVYLAGALPALPKGVTVTADDITVSDEDGEVEVSDVALDGNVWFASVSAAYIGQKLTIKAETGDELTYTASGGVEELTENGAAIALDLEISGEGTADYAGDDITIAKSFTVGEGVTVKIRYDGTLTVADGAELSVAGTLELTNDASVYVDKGGKLSVTGEVNVTGEEEANINVAGTLALDKDAKINVNDHGALDLTDAEGVEVSGTVAVANGGTLKVDTTDTEAFYGTADTGKLELAYGSTVYANEIGGIFLGTGDDAKFKWDETETKTDTPSKVVLEPNKLTLESGTLIVQNDVGITAGDEATIAEGAKLNVAAPFYVSGGLKVAGDLALTEDGTLNVVKDAAIDVAADATVDLTAGKVEVAGAVNVAAGGTLKVANTTTEGFYGAAGTGSLVLAEGSVVTVGVGDDAFNYLGGGEPVYKWEEADEGAKDGVLTLGPKSLTLTKGTLVLNKDNSIQSGDTATVTKDGTLKVAAGSTFNVEGTLDVAGTVTVEDGGTIKAPALVEGLPGPDGKVSFNGGTVELLKGATGYYGEALFISADDGGFYKWADDEADAKVTLKGGNVTEVTAGEVIAVADTGIAVGTTIQIAKDAKLSIAEEVTYTVGGTLDVAADAEVEVAGTFVTAAGSNGDLKGTITVTATGVSYDLNPGGGSLWKDDGSTGQYQFNAGSKAYVQLSGTDDPVLIIGDDDDEAYIKLTGEATFTNSQNAYELKGEATIAKAYGIASKTVTIDGTLTVADNLTLTGTTLTGADSSSAKIVLNAGKTITGANNFDTEASGVGPDTPVNTGARTYAWSGTDSVWNDSGASVTPPYTGNPDDGTIEITGFESGNTLYWLDKTEITVTAAVTGEGLTYRWELDGETIKDATSKTLKLEARNYEVRDYRLTVFVKDASGKENSSKDVTFTVAFEKKEAPAGEGE